MTPYPKIPYEIMYMSVMCMCLLPLTMQWPFHQIFPTATMTSLRSGPGSSLQTSHSLPQSQIHPQFWAWSTFTSLRSYSDLSTASLPSVQTSSLQVEPALPAPGMQDQLLSHSAHCFSPGASWLHQPVSWPFSTVPLTHLHHLLSTLGLPGAQSPHT